MEEAWDRIHDEGRRRAFEIYMAAITILPYPPFGHPFPLLIRLITMSGHDLSKYTTNEPAALLWFEQANYIAVNLGLIAYGAHYPGVILHQD
jgi:hypothetical protein